MNQAKKIFSYFIITLVSLTFLVTCNTTNTPSPEENVKAFIQAFQKQDFKQMSSYSEDGEDVTDLDDFDHDDPIAKMILEKLSIIECLDASSTIEGEKAIVHGKFKHCDLEKFFNEFLEESMSFALDPEIAKKSEEEINQIIMDKLEKKLGDIEPVESECDIHMVQVDKEWKIATDGNEDFLNILTGNALQMFQ